jgi:hypothetical protein
MKPEHETTSEKDMIAITDDAGQTAKLTPEQACTLLRWLNQRKGALAYLMHGGEESRQTREADEW